MSTQHNEKNLIAEEGELFQTHVGGSALIEGIMMRGKYNWAVAVRQPDGSIYTEEHDLPGAHKPQEWKKWPLVRGCIALFESMALSLKAMGIAADHAFDFSEEEQQAELKKELKKAKKEAKKNGEAFDDQAFLQAHASGDQNQEDTSESKNYDEGGYGLGGKELAVSMGLGLVLGIGGFIILPAFLTNLIMGDYSQNTLAWNAVDGLLRIVIFIAYIWLIGRMKDIDRMFGYHGAEHKAIHCFEHGKELTPENCQKFSTMHVRCGTAFLIMVLIISIFVFTICPTTAIIQSLGVTNPVLKLGVIILSRIILLPVVAGISYEITVKWAGARPGNPLVKVILWPGMQMQKLTTRTPDIGQLECAIAAMKLVIACEEEREKAGVKPVVFAQLPCEAAGQGGVAAQSKNALSKE